MTSTYPMIYRLNSPPGLKGRRCKVVALSLPRRRPGVRAPIMNVGNEPTGIQFEDGTALTVPRSAIVSAGSRPGRAVAARVARGDTKIH